MGSIHRCKRAGKEARVGARVGSVGGSYLMLMVTDNSNSNSNNSNDIIIIIIIVMNIIEIKYY